MTAVAKVNWTIHSPNPTRYTIGRTIAPDATPNLAYTRLATTIDTVKDVAVIAVESRPRAVATSASVPNASEAAVSSGYDTEKLRIARRTYATATKRISGDAATKSKPARTSASTDEGAPRRRAGARCGKRARSVAPVTSSTASITTRASVPAARLTGPAISVPRKLPAIAAPVSSGKSRLACRASKAEPATVQ